MRWLDRIPLLWLAPIAALLAVAPVLPEPHLLEKLRLLSQGQLTKPIDTFDLLLHSVPAGLLALRLWRDRRRRHP
jgi:hypothetical protein